MQAGQLEFQTDKDKKIEIKKIKLKHLAEFARNTVADPAFGDVAPISVLRAVSQSRNPLGDPEDLALLVALYENRCIGFHGLLPGSLTDKTRASKIYWLITFYLDAAFRGRGYGKQLVAEILNANVDLVTTGITRGAEAVYRRAGFRQLGELRYFQLRPACTDKVKAVLQNLSSGEKQFIVKAVTRLPETDNRAAAVAFQRDRQTINWMIGNPWVVSRPEARQDVGNYYFSRVRDLFRFIALEISAPDGQHPKGYLVISVSSKKNKTVLKVLDFEFHDPQDIFIAGYLALKYADKYGADRLEYPVDLESFFDKQTGLKDRVKRKNVCIFTTPTAPTARWQGWRIK